MSVLGFYPAEFQGFSFPHYPSATSLSVGLRPVTGGGTSTSDNLSPDFVTRRHVRTAADVLTDVSDGENRTDTKLERQNKIMWSSLVEEPEETVARLKKSSDQRLPKGNEPVWVFAGERSLWSLIYAWFPLVSIGSSVILF